MSYTGYLRPFPEGNHRMKSQKSMVSDDSLNSEIGFSTLAITNLDSDNTNYVSMEKDEDIMYSSNPSHNSTINNEYSKLIQRNCKKESKQEIQQVNEVKGGRVQSLYSTLRELADDNSYKTNFDKFQKADSEPDP